MVTNHVLTCAAKRFLVNFKTNLNICMMSTVYLFPRRNKRPRCPLDNLNFDPVKVRYMQYVSSAISFFFFAQTQLGPVQTWWPGHRHQSEHSLFLVPEHKFGHRALATGVVLGHQSEHSLFLVPEHKFGHRALATGVVLGH